MKTILGMILLANLCMPASVRAWNAHHKASLRGTETTGECVGADSIRQGKKDTVRHQPITETTVKLNEIVVNGLTGSQKLRQSPAPISFVGERQLESQASTNIIDAISKQPGVSQITTGSSISKPVIRGLGYNRVVVVNDGIRQEGQQWGDEHGIEIDPAAVHSAEIIKGPASLMYGSDAMAGVIVFRRNPVVPQGEMRASLSTGYQTNNGMTDYSVNFAGNRHHTVWDTRYSGGFAHAYKNRYDGYVYGSAFRQQAFSQLIGRNYRRGYSHLTLSLFHLTPGIIEGERDEVTGLLLVPDGYQRKGYGRPMPYQEIYHYKTVADNSWHMGDGKVNLLLGYQRNSRQEYEEEENPKECGLDFLLHTINYNLHYLSGDMSGWKFSSGINGMWQESANRGTEFLIPAYRLFDYGLFATVSKEIGHLNMSGGIRYDHRHLCSKAFTEEEEGNMITRFEAFKRNFSGVTGSLGMAYEILPDLSIKANIARGFRAPNISELSSNGVHEGTQRYELGNKGLKAENSWQFDLGLSYTSSIVSAELTLFANRINRYIYSARKADEDGQPAVSSEQMPVYQFTAGNARLWGGEARVDVHPTHHLHFGNSMSYVNARQLHQSRDSRNLPFIPAPRWISDVRYEFICDGRTFDHLFLKLQIDCNMRQDHFLAANGTETATPAYTLLNLQAGTDIRCKGRRILSIYLSGDNLTNRAYQNHLSRLKYLDVNQATGRMGVYNMGRNFSMRLVVPLRLCAQKL